MPTDFALCIGTGEAPGPFPVEVLSSPAGSASGEMVLPEGIDELLAAVRRDSPDVRALQEFGTKLYSAVFTGDVGRAWSDSHHARVGRQEGGLRLRLRVDDPGLEEFPWELLHDERSFLDTNPDLLFSRYWPGAEHPPSDRSGKLRLLTVLETPEKTPLTAPDFLRHLREFESLLGELPAHQVECTILKDASPEAFRSTLEKGFDVVHFSGHGAGPGLGALMDDDHNRLRKRGDGEFAQLFQGLRSPPLLVVLNACVTAAGAGSSVFSDVGSFLVRSGVPAVVATQYPFVRHGSARIFAKAFYESLANALPVEAAVKAARRMLSSGGYRDHRDWSAPILYQCSSFGEGTKSGIVATEQRSASVVLDEIRSTNPTAHEQESLLVRFRSDLSRVIAVPEVEKVIAILRSYQENRAALALAESATVLETFDGFVDRIAGDTAFVTLQSTTNGDVEEGTYPASELARLGIFEQSCFIAKTVETRSGIRVVFEAAPDEALSDEVVHEIESKIDQVLPREDPGIRY